MFGFTAVIGRILKSVGEHGIDNRLLFLIQSLKDIGERSIVFTLLCVCMSQRCIILFRIFIGFHCTVLNVVISTNDRLSFISNHRAICMLESEIINICLRIRTGDDQADFANGAMNNVFTLLDQRICIDRKSFNIAMSNRFFGILCICRIVQTAISIDTVFAIFKNCVTQNVTRFIVQMLPYERHRLPIVVLKSILKNRTTIRTFQPDLSGITTKIILRFISHYSYFLLFITLMRSIQIGSDICLLFSRLTRTC